MNKEDIGHLIVARKIGEVIEIGDNIEIVIKNIARGYVTLHIAAPKSMPIIKERTFNSTRIMYE